MTTKHSKSKPLLNKQLRAEEKVVEIQSTWIENLGNLKMFQIVLLSMWLVR